MSFKRKIEIIFNFKKDRKIRYLNIIIIVGLCGIVLLLQSHDYKKLFNNFYYKINSNSLQKFHKENLMKKTHNRSTKINWWKLYNETCLGDDMNEISKCYYSFTSFFINIFS